MNRIAIGFLFALLAIAVAGLLKKYGSNCLDHVSDTTHQCCNHDHSHDHNHDHASEKK